VEVRETRAKADAKRRDHFRCRRCGTAMIAGALLTHMEAAHLRDKGMGGDGGRYSSHQRDFICLCHGCHQGPRSLHSGHIRAVYGPEGGDGRVTFEDVLTQKLLHIRVKSDA
jgi:hypothetical protein